MSVQRLRAENALLMAEVDRLMALVESNLKKSKMAMAKSDACIRTLEEQVERLTKAGDTMMGWIDHQHDDSGYPHSEAWEAAKEGKPNA